MAQRSCHDEAKMEHDRPKWAKSGPTKQNWPNWSIRGEQLTGIVRVNRPLEAARARGIIIEKEHSTKQARQDLNTPLGRWPGVFLQKCHK